jgi:hypothetical protein
MPGESGKLVACCFRPEDASGTDSQPDNNVASAANTITGSNLSRLEICAVIFIIENKEVFLSN